ncbi:unnamed protein product [Sordaria macrospora k-hell]|uniref:WGS project CABT00000000 data, contig 2.433 n=1 Tax=Sordaria macrospora (strain ATCC MYA-333 / DSM 997 / K(L3346) / K-hell) TaxID=771870 RepID=F7WCY8_SORMK|nr:unnamed protein product [Sordaria macrospora k-hell]
MVRSCRPTSSTGRRARVAHREKRAGGAQRLDRGRGRDPGFGENRAIAVGDGAQELGAPASIAPSSSGSLTTRIPPVLHVAKSSPSSLSHHLAAITPRLNKLLRSGAYCAWSGNSPAPIAAARRPNVADAQLRREEIGRGMFAELPFHRRRDLGQFLRRQGSVEDDRLEIEEAVRSRNRERQCFGTPTSPALQRGRGRRPIPIIERRVVD